MVQINLDKIFFKTQTYDPSTNLPIYILDSTALPNPESCDFLNLIEILISRIPNHNYSLIFFTCGLSASPNLYNNEFDEKFKFSWVWGVKTFSLLPQQKRKFLRKLYVVHECWWIRALIEVLKNVLSSKFISNNNKRIIHCSNITELSKNIDITKLQISLSNYLYDSLKLNNKIIIPIHLVPIFNIKITQKNKLSWFYYNLLFFKISNRLLSNISAISTQNSDSHSNSNSNSNSDSHSNSKLKSNLSIHNQLLLKNPTDEFQKSKITILIDSIKRNQLIDLNDWDILSLINVWKFFLKFLPTNLIPVSSIKLPIKDNNLSYINSILNSILNTNDYHFLLNDLMNLIILPCLNLDLYLISIDFNKNINNQYKNISLDELNNNYLIKFSKSLVSYFSGNLDRNDLLVSSRFLKNLIKLWPYLDANYDKLPSSNFTHLQNSIFIQLNSSNINNHNNHNNHNSALNNNNNVSSLLRKLPSSSFLFPINKKKSSSSILNSSNSSISLTLSSSSSSTSFATNKSYISNIYNNSFLPKDYLGLLLSSKTEYFILRFRNDDDFIINTNLNNCFTKLYTNKNSSNNSFVEILDYSNEPFSPSFSDFIPSNLLNS
ncbi:CRAL-TRIO domain-containing protein ASCRUDRAFT_50828, partial [Ascoidea rubescens DSM 1968]